MDVKRDGHEHAREEPLIVAPHWLKEREYKRFKYQWAEAQAIQLSAVASRWFIKDPLLKSSPSIDGCISDEITCNGYPNRLTPDNKAYVPSHFHPIAPPQGPIKPIHWAHCSNTERLHWSSFAPPLMNTASWIIRRPGERLRKRKYGWERVKHYIFPCLCIRFWTWIHGDFENALNTFFSSFFHLNSLSNESNLKPKKIRLCKLSFES